MRREVSLEEISDGRLYSSSDMVKIGCDDCRGCSECCRGMGSSIILDPYDVFRMENGLGKRFEELLLESLELNLADGLILPNLKMAGEREACVYLNEEGRCRIHPYRPGFCRMFPLGRIYEDDGFKYFNQIHECRREQKTKVKVRKWLDTPETGRYETFILEWHGFLKELEERLSRAEGGEARKQVSMYVLKCFYLQPFEGNRDFYEQFRLRLKEAQREILNFL